MKLYNPWRIIRELRAQVAHLEGRLDEVSERAEEAEGRAFYRAARHWQFEYEREREAKMAAIQQMSQLANLTPIAHFVPKDAFQGFGQ